MTYGTSLQFAFRSRDGSFRTTVSETTVCAQKTVETNCKQIFGNHNNTNRPMFTHSNCHVHEYDHNDEIRC